MIIKAKYPETERPYMRKETQGYGAHRGGNNSVVNNSDTTHSVSVNRPSSSPD